MYHYALAMLKIIALILGFVNKTGSSLKQTENRMYLKIVGEYVEN